MDCNKMVVRDLTKQYGKKTVLNGVDVEFEKGKIYSIIGVNGAGKTTFFNCVDGDIDYDKGDVKLCENGIERDLSFEDVGLVVDTPVLPEFLTGYEYIYYFANMHGGADEASINHYFDIISIKEEDRHKLVRDYSFGMKNKLQLLCCLIRKPEIILLDEPLSSFDIIVSHEIKQLLVKMKKDHIIVMSTHIMQLAQDISDEIVILKDGKMTRMSQLDVHDPEFEQYIINELSNKEETL